MKEKNQFLNFRNIRIGACEYYRSNLMQDIFIIIYLN